MKKKNVILNFVRYFFLTLLSVLLIINIYIMIQTKINPNRVPEIFGYKPFIVLSGSMENEINVGDLVFVKEVETDELNTGDIIAFRDEDNIVTTHRITKIVKNEKNEVCFETKGDNNNTEDSELACYSKVEGKYSGKIAKIGSIIIFVQKPLGFIVMMMSVVIICMLIYFFSNKNSKLMFENEEEKKAFEEFKKAKRLDKK